MAESLLAKIIRQHYEQLLESGEEFTLDDVIALVLADASLDSVTSELVEAAVAGQVRKVDDRFRSEGESSQLGLFGNSDQVIAFGDGRRRRRGSMTLPNVLAHQALVDDNEAAVIESARRERHRTGELLPYLEAAPINWDEAVRLWLEDHPGEEW